MRWPGANLEEKHEPRGVSVAEAQNGDSMKSSGRNLTLAAIEKHEPRGVSVAEAQNGDSMKSSGRNLTLAAIEKRIGRLIPRVFPQSRPLRWCIAAAAAQPWMRSVQPLLR